MRALLGLWRNNPPSPGGITLQICAHLVQVFQGQDDLCDVDAHVLLGELLPLVQVREELPAAYVICSRCIE